MSRAKPNPMDFVEMYLHQTSHLPAQGHYINAVACRKSAVTRKDDAKSRCLRCDAEDLMRGINDRVRN